MIVDKLIGVECNFQIEWLKLNRNIHLAYLILDDKLLIKIEVNIIQMNILSLLNKTYYRRD